MRVSTAPPFYAILLISAAALAYELLLMRLFSIIQWHHFAYMVISLALLGYGVSGALLTLLRHRLLPWFGGLFVGNAALFGISAIGCFLLVQLLPINTQEMLWDVDQWRYLLLSYLLLFVPFFFAANAICLTFAKFGGLIPRIYAFDLIGAGLGALGIIITLYLLTPQSTLQLLAMVGLLAAALGAIECGLPAKRTVVLSLIILLFLVFLIPEQWLRLRPSEYKALSQALQREGAVIKDEHSSPLGLITLVENKQIPFRYAPGLSLSSTIEPPPQLAVFIDGEAAGAITRYDGEMARLQFLDQQTSALPYYLRSPERVLILGLGGGSAILQGLYENSDRIDVVELNPQIVRIFTEYISYSGWHLLQERSHLKVAEARAFVAASPDQFDLIQISLLDSSGAASAGLYALNESYLYTLEGIQDYLRRLTPDGMLAITRWVNVPPRDGLKLAATAIEALRQSGISEPGSHLIMIRGWSTFTLVIGNRPFTRKALRQLRVFCNERFFDRVFYPGIPAAETNSYNILAEPYYYQGVQALLGDESEHFIQRYKFDIRPATDDRPYFFNFFKWSTLPEIFSLYRRGGYSLLELGYPVLIITLLQAILASLILILLPLVLIKRFNAGEGRAKECAIADPQREKSEKPGYAGWVMLYFVAIGLAFLYIEIAFIQRFILFLGNPLYAVAVVLAGFLLFSGLGSRRAGKPDSWSVHTVVIVLCAIALTYLWLLPHLFSWMAGMPGPLRILLSLLLIAPLAYCMGMPFPLGLARVSRQSPRLVPWAWGINGCASLISAILATLLALHLGFTWVILTALVFYLIAAIAAPRLE